METDARCPPPVLRSLFEHRACEGRWTYSWILGVPKIRALYETTSFAGLRKAGMPEE